MASQVMRASAARWKDEADAAAGPGGSSYQNFLAMVGALSIDSPNSEV